MAETTDKTQTAQNHKSSPDRDLEQAISDYLIWMEGEGYAHNTYEKYKQMLNQFLSHVITPNAVLKPYLFIRYLRFGFNKWYENTHG